MKTKEKNEKGRVMQKLSVGSISFTWNYNGSAIATKNKKTVRPSDEVDGPHVCQKCVMKKKKKDRHSFPHQKRPLAFCARCKTRSLPMLNSGSCFPFPRGPCAKFPLGTHDWLK